MPIGPSLPPSAEKRKRSDDEDSSDSDDEVGPQLPPSSVEESKSKKPRTIGPSLPPPVSSKHSTKAEDEDDSEDDGFGPALPPSNSKAQPATDPKSTKDTDHDSRPPPKPQIVRDEWMTMAPKGGDWSQRVDPTKLKSRKFNTGRSSNSGTAAPSSSAGDSSWHETPEQKQARLKRQVLGITKHDERSMTSTHTSHAEDVETVRRMKEYNKQRGPSLYEAHQKKTNQDGEVEDDPSARAFDREKDMGAGVQLNSTQRREMLKKSANFNSRFSSAKYL